MPCVFCADIGTSSLKAAVIDQTGNVLSYSRQKFHADPDSVAGQWLGAIKAAMDEIFQNEGLKADAICISGNGPTLSTCGGLTLLWNREIPEPEEDPSEAEKKITLHSTAKGIQETLPRGME
jgi:predicted NBD/HSP70 family sugar kinase